MIVQPAFKRSLLAIAICSVPFAQAASVVDPGSSTITAFEEVLGLTVTGLRSGSAIDNIENMGLSVADRRGYIQFESGATLADSEVTTTPTNDVSGLDDLSGSLTSYLFRYFDTSVTYTTGRLTLGTGTTGNESNKPLILDLGESDLTVSNGDIQTQGAYIITTVNSNASRGGLFMDESTGSGANNAFKVDESTTGQIKAQELVDVGSAPAPIKLLLDLNSSFENGASFDFLTETAGIITQVPFVVIDSVNSNLFDTSYVINSSAELVTVGNNEKIVITFQRDDNVYIIKSETDNHPSNDAALKLGIIAARGVAEGDMQTALTRLDINDFGYGNDQQPLAVQVKRLAPLANNSFVISSFDATDLASDALGHRIAARRGNWSGNSDLDQSFWIQALGSKTNSSGSVPVATLAARDTAGHDGFESSTQGFVAGLDKQFDKGLLGVSYGRTHTDLTQLDDRKGETSNLGQNTLSVYGQYDHRGSFVSAVASRSTGSIDGWRRTAIDRIANYNFGIENQQISVKAGQRFDLSDGRSAITPYLELTKARFTQDRYVEQGAGDLSLDIAKLEADKSTVEVGVSASHKGRFSGVKALTVLTAAVGQDFDVSDLTVNANYTGPTSDAYTGFTTPAENWAQNYLKLGLDLQLEAKTGMMVKLGLDGEMRQGRQNYAGEVALVWVF